MAAKYQQSRSQPVPNFIGAVLALAAGLEASSAGMHASTALWPIPPLSSRTPQAIRDPGDAARRRPSPGSSLRFGRDDNGGGCADHLLVRQEQEVAVARELRPRLQVRHGEGPVAALLEPVEHRFGAVAGAAQLSIADFHVEDRSEPPKGLFAAAQGVQFPAFDVGL